MAQGEALLKPKSLSSRLLLVTVIALLPTVVIALSVLATLRHDQKIAMKVEAQRTSEQIALELQQTVYGAESVLRAVSAAPVTRNSMVEECSALMEEAANAVDFLSAIIILDTQGHPRCASSRVDDLMPQAGGLVDAALARGKPVFGAPLFDTRKPGVLPLALPIGGSSTAPLGVAVGYLDLKWLETRLQTRSLSPGGSMTIADPDGYILARVPAPEEFVGTKVPDDFMYLLQATAAGSEEVVSQDGTRRILGYSPPGVNGLGLYVSAGLSVDEGYSTLRAIATQAAILTLVGSMMATALAFYVARVSISQPVNRVLDTVSQWRDGNTDARTGMDPLQGEICAAGASLDSFMAELVANREARRQAEEVKDLLRDELEHRVKNLLATIRAIARQTFRREGNEAALQAFSRRVAAIGDANSLLKEGNWQSTALRSLVVRSLSTFVGDALDERVRVTGPDLVVQAGAATALAMTLHELSTNAVKYGALSQDGGRVDIGWRTFDRDGSPMFELLWQEVGGPPVTPPDQDGFGTKVIQNTFPSQTGGTVSVQHLPDGVVCRMTAPAAAVLADGPAPDSPRRPNGSPLAGTPAPA